MSMLAVLALLLRSAVVTPKLLVRARERFSGAGKTPDLPSFKWEDAAVLGTHYSTLLMLGLAIAALATMRWWFPTAAPELATLPPIPKRTLRYRSMLFGLVLLAAGLRLPLATGSLWWDELWNMKFATVGEWRQDVNNADSVKFLPTSWARAAWYYNKPTNHPVFTLPSKLCHTVWQNLTGAAPGTFSEIVLRLHDESDKGRLFKTKAW